MENEKRIKEIVSAAKEHGYRSEFSDIVKSPLSKGVDSAYGIGFKEIRTMDKEKVKQTTVYHNILYSLCNVLPVVDREMIANNVMPILEEIIGVYCDTNSYINEAVSKATKPMIVKRDNFVKERFVEKACSFLESAVAYVECDDCYNFETDEFIKNFKKFMEE